MNILNQLNPESNEVFIDGKKWEFDYKVWELIELEETIIVHFLSKDFRVNPPKGVYIGNNIWCYRKKDKSIKWIIEEPPLMYGESGKPNRGFSTYFPDIRLDELYLNVHYSEYYDSIMADTTGARRFKVDHETGKVELVATGLR